MTPMNYVRKFLVMNGFRKLTTNSYDNGKCNVIITESGYEIADSYGATMYSKDHTIYWLIGALTYLDFMDKNYKQ